MSIPDSCSITFASCREYSE